MSGPALSRRDFLRGNRSGSPTGPGEPPPGVVFSLLVHAHAEAFAPLIARIGELGGEIPADPQQGKLIAVFETEDDSHVHPIIGQLSEVPGVVSVNPVYLYHDDDT